MTHWLVMGYRALCFRATNTNLPWEESYKIVTVDQLLYNPRSSSTPALHTLHTFPRPPIVGLKDPIHDLMIRLYLI